MPTAWDRQIHRLCERAQDLYERGAVLYESAAVVCCLPQDRGAFTESLSKQSRARYALPEAIFNEPRVPYELAEGTYEDTLGRGEAAEVMGKANARRREIAPSREPLSQVPCSRDEVTGRFEGDGCPSALDRYA